MLLSFPVFPFRIAPVLTALGLALPSLAAADDGFIGLGTLGGTHSRGLAVSSNGLVAAGYSSRTGETGSDAFRWVGGVMTSLGTLGGTSSYGHAISGDGSTVAGSSYLAGDLDIRAFRWTQAGGIVNLGTLGGAGSQAHGVSGNGSVVVGYSDLAGPDYHAFRWTQADGMVDIGTLTGGTRSIANAVSHDGSVVVGYGNTTGGVNHAFRWSGGSMADLGTLGGNNSMALGVSSDGGVVVGSSNIAGDVQNHAFRWTGGVMADLGTLSGHTHSSAYAVSANGAVVVGNSSPTGFSNWKAFRWTQTSGMQSVEAWLSAAGVAVPAGRTLEKASGVSADGSVVVGTSTNATGDSLAYLARVGGAGTGLITNTNEYSASLVETGGVGYVYGNFNWHVATSGAHHRSLLDNGLVRTSIDGGCAWATAESGGQSKSELRIDLAEVGVCKDIGSTRIGLGVGQTRARQDWSLGGSAKFDGQYLVAELAHAFGESLEASVLGMYGTNDTRLNRRYMNGAAVDSSSGRPDATNTALRLRADWRNAAQIGTFGISPYVSYMWGKARVDGYTETGGGFPAIYKSANIRSDDVRLGAAAKTALSPATDLRLTVEAAHHFGRDAGAVEVQVIGLGDFSSLPVKNIKSNSARAIIDLDHRISKTSALTFSAIGGNFDGHSTWILSGGYRASF